MTEKTLTTENIKPALDALRGELAPWPVVAKKQDRLNTAQLNAANSGITSSLVAQIIANTAAIRALESAITGTGLRALVVASLPAVGTTGILYIVPVTTYDPETDADVVNYSNEYIWIPVEGGQASEGHYEQVGQTGIVINNGQLNITVNGTSVGTFTANQSGNTTAAITVPTNADYVDRTTDQTVAGVKTFSSTINGTASKAIADEDGTSIKTGYVNVAGNQTVSGDKSFTGSNTFNNILPNATSVYSLGSSSYQWSSVYAQTYYYNGTQWGLDKANTWTGTNTFSKDNLEVQTEYTLGTLPQAESAVTLFTGRTTDNNFVTNINFYQSPTRGTGLRLTIRNKWDNNGYSTTGTTRNAHFEFMQGADRTAYIQWQGYVNNNLYPLANNTYDLGTSTNKWKTFNGINPGILNHVDASVTQVDIDTTGWVLDGSAWNTFNTSSYIDGWLYLSYMQCAVDDYISVRLGSTNYSKPTLLFKAEKLADNRYYIYATIPVTKKFNIYLEIKTSGTLVAHGLYPSLGNV